MLLRSLRLFTSKVPASRPLINKTGKAKLSLTNKSVTDEDFRFSRLIKPFVFTASFCGGSFAMATIWKYENSRTKQWSTLGDFQITRSNRLPRTDPLFRLRQFWNSQTEGFKIFCGIAAINTAVFLLWRLPNCRPVMLKYFMSSVESRSYRILPMLLSNFSHYSLTHLGVNMFVLYSFSNISVHTFGKEDFLALYLSSGVVSAFVSLAYKVAISSVTPSLGASGAILGILGAICTERPDIQLMIIFLPFFSFSSDTALKGIIAMDTLGTILRWGFFDHAAHLGGTLFGVLYSRELRAYFKRNRGHIIRRWIELKQRF